MTPRCVPDDAHSRVLWISAPRTTIGGRLADCHMDDSRQAAREKSARLLALRAYFLRMTPMRVSFSIHKALTHS